MTQEELRGWFPRGRSLAITYLVCSVCRKPAPRGYSLLNEEGEERRHWATLCDACNQTWRELNRDYLVALELMK